MWYHLSRPPAPHPGRYLQHGTFDAKSGEYEYIWRPDSQAPMAAGKWRLVFLTGAFYVGNGWVAWGCWDDDITSDDWDPSRKFPAFSTSKFFGGLSLYRISIKEFSKHLRPPLFLRDFPGGLIPLLL